MQPDEKGFLYPVIDPDVCIDCGKCVGTCPIKNTIKTSGDVSCFAMRLLDEEPLKKSSSGGVAYGLSKVFLYKGGVVYGAAYDEKNRVVHIRVERLEELFRLQGSKYVQSDVRGVFPRVKEDLEQGRAVLFIGTGCQIGGLCSYLGCDYEALLTVDVICLGTPSPKLWERYLNEEIDKYSPCTVNMRDKIKGWATPSFALYRNGKTLKTDVITRSSYLRLFENCYGLRESCFDCSFKFAKHCADLTIGDCWGMERLVKTRADDGLGMSMVFVNSEKGRSLLGKCDDLFWREELVYDDAVKENLMLINSVNHPKDEEDFWETVKEHSIKKTAYTFVPDDPFILKMKKALYPLKQKLFGNK